MGKYGGLFLAGLIALGSISCVKNPQPPKSTPGSTAASPAANAPSPRSESGPTAQPGGAAQGTSAQPPQTTQPGAAAGAATGPAQGAQSGPAAGAPSVSYSQPAPPGAPASGQAVPAAVPTQPGKPALQPPAGIPATPSGIPANRSVPLPVKNDNGIQSLITLDRGKRFFPQDFKIGQLAGPRDLEGDEKAAITGADSFLRELIQGKVDKGLVAADATALSDSLSYSLEKGDVPSSYRLGKSKRHDDGEISFNVRLFGGEGSAEGEIYLSGQKGGWLVSDFQISLSQMREKPEKPNEKFFPSTYGWLLGGE